MPDAPPPQSPPPHPLQYPAPAIAPPHAFTSDHLVAIAEAKKRFAPIRREIGVATFDAWSVAVFAGLTVLFSLTSPPALLVGLGMGVVAFIEFRAIKRLNALDPTAPRTLGLNQVGFATVLILYAAYKLLTPGDQMISADAMEVAAADPQLAASLKSLSATVNLVLYCGVIAFAVIFQGGCALYHFTRTPILKRYVGSTAPWLLQLHSAGLMR
jgi:hypothetical protein